MAETNIGAFALIGALIGAVPAVLSVVMPWLRSRDYVARSNREVELAKNRVEFIASWLDAKKASSTPEEFEVLKRRVGERLDGILESSEAALAPGLVPEPEARSSTPRVRRNRTFFYVAFGFFAFLVFGSSVDDDGNSTWSQLVNSLEADTGMYVFFLLPVAWTLFLWMRARRAS